MSEDAARHPIGVVARRTGLSTEVIRAWEQRYGAVDPARTEGGQRLYSEADVRRLRLLAAAVEAGHRIGAIAGLGEDLLLETVRGLGGAVPAGAAAGPPSMEPEAVVAAALEAVAAADARALRDQLRRAAVMLEPMRFIEGVMVPFLDELGGRWEAGDVTPAHEHVASTVVRDVLGWLLENTSVPVGAPLLLVGVPAGQRHEFGALLAGVTAGVAGWTVLSLGGDLPARDIAALATQTGARALALSVVYAADGSATRAELAHMRAALDAGTLILVGGRAASDIGTVEGVETVVDLSALRARLEQHARASA